MQILGLRTSKKKLKKRKLDTGGKAQTPRGRGCGKNPVKFSQRPNELTLCKDKNFSASRNDHPDSLL